jgi:transcriptional regulator with XRE-family HTH domain
MSEKITERVRRPVRSVAINGPNPVDVHVGQRVREQRIVRGMSQEQLGTAIGLTFQQLQKYERGTNRISASKLYAIARELGVSVAWFFEGILPKGRDAASNAAPIGGRAALEVGKAFASIRSPALRKKVAQLVRAAAAIEGVKRAGQRR